MVNRNSKVTNRHPYASSLILVSARRAVVPFLTFFLAGSTSRERPSRRHSLFPVLQPLLKCRQNLILIFFRYTGEKFTKDNRGKRWQ